MQEDWIGLARRARDGDLDAFEGLVERFKRPLCAAVHPILRDWHLTQDVAQEAFAAAFARIRDLEEPVRFRALLYQIARNRAVSQLRSAIVRKAAPLHFVREEDVRGLPDRTGGAVRAERPRPSEAALEKVRRVVLGLPHDYGSLLLMRYVEGMSVGELARVVGRSERAVKAVLYRARLTARSSLRRAGLTMERIFHEM